MINWNSNVNHANSNAIDETANKEHPNMNGCGLQDRRHQADGTSYLDSKTPATSVQQPGNEATADDTTTCKEGIIGYGGKLAHVLSCLQ